MKKGTKKKEVTIDGLAIMVQRGFESTALKIDMDEGFVRVDKRLDIIDKRLDRNENILIRAHENRIERLEDELRIVKTHLKLV